LVVAVLAGGGWMLTRERPVPPARSEPVKAAAVVPVGQPGRVAINAFPWANVTSVRNLDSGESVDIGTNVVTPAPLDLAPGRYEVTLANPGFVKPITRTVSVAPSGDVELYVTFSDPASASVPDFGGAD
jgi:hypothetical protein